MFGAPVVVDGFRLIDSRASYGLGLETFALGFPIHFDYAWKTLFNKDWEDQVFAAFGGHSWFREPQFTVWNRVRLLGRRGEAVPRPLSGDAVRRSTTAGPVRTGRFLCTTRRPSP